MSERFTEIFFLLFCEKNSDGTKNLILKGRDLQQRIGKRLNDEDVVKLIDFLAKHKEVVKLNLCYNYFGDEGFRELCKQFLYQDDNNLLHLNVMNCNLTSNSIERLFFAHQTLKLKCLRLNGNKLGYMGGRFAAILLTNLPSLLHLDMGDTDQTVDSVNFILVRAVDSQIQILDISRVIPASEWYQYGSERLSDHLAVFLERNQTIVELHAQKCQFDGHDIELLVNGLKYNKSLKFLDLGYNRIGEYGIDVLAEWLSTRPELLGLNVAGNDIKNTGARALSFGMPFSKLRFLDLSYNRITDDGIIDILNSIKKSYMLRMFYFWGNIFGHRTNLIIERMLLSKVLVQEYIDVNLYKVDDVLYAARYPADHYKHRYYQVMDYGCPVELKIKKIKGEKMDAKPRALVRFECVDRYPPLSLTKK